MTNTYGAGNGLLTKSTYGNGDYNEYVYDDLGRTTRVNKNGSKAYYWRYNASGLTAMHTDYVSDRVYYYTHDSLGRIVSEYEKTYGEDEYRFANNYTYDTSNNLTKLVNTADGNKVTTKYSYDASNRPSKTTLNSNVSHTYTYDVLGRLNKNTISTSGTDPIVVTYTYWLSKRNEGTDQTYRTTQIGWESFNGRTYGYTYDKVGNITEIKEKPTSTGSYTVKATYTYDELGQLKTEINVDLGQKIVYTYDTGGNIKSKAIYAYTNGTVGELQKTINYTYDSTWKDKLVTYDGDSITYDAIGNPLTYRDGMSFTWQGRQMKTANLNGTSVSYKYNADGLRTYKKVGSTVHEYEYSGDKLFYEKRGDIKFYYRYDAFGNLATIKRIKADGTEFSLYVICNSRGDVEELRKTNGDLYARYIYDSWGNTIKIINADGDKITDTANLSVQNPFRYRGYYFDAESGLYYLQSRYYDPVTGRFVNPDSLVDTSHVLGFNMYAYCGNNPVNNVDPTGHAWYHWALGAAIVAACAVATVATAGGFAYAATAIGFASMGLSVGGATGVAAMATVASATVLGVSALGAAMNSSSVSDFNEQGTWWTVAGVATAGFIGGYSGYSSDKSSSTSSASTPKSKSSTSIHTSGIGSPKNNVNANGSYTKLDHKGNIYSYTQFDSLSRQSMRIDFQGRAHNGVLPHTHVYLYPEQGGRIEYVFDMNWNLIG